MSYTAVQLAPHNVKDLTWHLRESDSRMTRCAGRLTATYYERPDLTLVNCEACRRAELRYPSGVDLAALNYTDDEIRKASRNGHPEVLDTAREKLGRVL